LRDSTTKTIQLINNSNLQAKYFILPQTEESKVLAQYEVDKESGTILENATETITVRLTTKKLGEIPLQMHINIVGCNKDSPYVLNIMAISDGP
jgi:hypothetical protein